eukprot:scaffold119972_cov30-Phaeocystis_antarctica.AAC.1
MSRSKSEKRRPPSAAASLTTVGRSWRWSPSSTSWRQPWVMGTSTLGSVAWATWLGLGLGLVVRVGVGVG